MRSVLALDIGGTKLVAAVVSADGSVRCRRVTASRPSEGADQVIERAIDLAATVRQEHGAEEPLDALGVSTKGLTREDGVMISGMPGWSRLTIPARLRQGFPDMAVSIMNDVKAATLAEVTWGALQSVANGLYVNLGTGIAAGIVAGGEILEGAHGAAGEIGYIVPGLEALRRAAATFTAREAAPTAREAAPTAREAAPTAREDMVAPLEQLIGGLGVPARALGELGSELTMEQLTERGAHDAKAAALVDEILTEVALWIVNVAIVVDPERVVVGGGFVRSSTDVCGKIRAVVDKFALFPPEVRPAHYGADSALMGAGALALRS
jgi:glucokinase